MRNARSCACSDCQIHLVAAPARTLPAPPGVSGRLSVLILPRAHMREKQHILYRREFVNNMTRRSIPILTCGWRHPYSSAVIYPRRSAWLPDRRHLFGQPARETPPDPRIIELRKPFASSRPPTISSKRSVTSGLFSFRRASGDTSIGYSVIKLAAPMTPQPAAQRSPSGPSPSANFRQMKPPTALLLL